MYSETTEWALMSECRLLLLKGFEVKTRIGIHDFELRAPQRLLIDVELYVPLKYSTPNADHISEVVDYDFIRQVILKRIELGHINLQETLVDDVLRELLLHEGVRAARVSSSKPDVYPDCASVGVQVFKFKA